MFNPVSLYARVCLDFIIILFYKLFPGQRRDEVSLDCEHIFKLISNRSIQLQKADEQLQKVIVTCYFTAKKDPQHGVIRSIADIRYIAPWYHSVNKLKLNGIVFYDELPDSFIQQYQTSYVQFRKCTIGDYSIFEERWIIYYLFLKSTTAPFVFFTDASDVTVNKDPFELDIASGKLFAGRDIANRIWQSSWMMNEIKSFETDAHFSFPRPFYYMPVFNAGIVGGKKEPLLALIAHMIVMTFKTATDHHKDMVLLNYAIYSQLRPDLKASIFEKKVTDPNDDAAASNRYLVTGFPLNSAFKVFEKNSSAFFSHK
ncbi:hypothetical protein BH10BAC2_BH10BAC2_16400 [soil metagenome]